MMDTVEIVKILKKFNAESAHKYGIKSLGIFGSFARCQQNEASDLDIFVMLQESDYFILEKIKEELEHLIHFKVDVVNFRDSLRESFKQNILRDAIYI